MFILEYTLHYGRAQDKNVLNTPVYQGTTRRRISFPDSNQKQDKFCSAPHMAKYQDKTTTLSPSQMGIGMGKRNGRFANNEKIFLKVKSVKFSQQVSLPHQFVQILTGHSCLKTFLNRIGAAETRLCSCGNVETVEPPLPVGRGGVKRQI